MRKVILIFIIFYPINIYSFTETDTTHDTKLLMVNIGQTNNKFNTAVGVRFVNLGGEFAWRSTGHDETERDYSLNLFYFVDLSKYSSLYSIIGGFFPEGILKGFVFGIGSYTSLNDGLIIGIRWNNYTLWNISIGIRF
jgi:hypothetical protein